MSRTKRRKKLEAERKGFFPTKGGGIGFLVWAGVTLYGLAAAAYIDLVYMGGKNLPSFPSPPRGNSQLFPDTFGGTAGPPPESPKGSESLGEWLRTATAKAVGQISKANPGFALLLAFTKITQIVFGGIVEVGISAPTPTPTNTPTNTPTSTPTDTPTPTPTDTPTPTPTDTPTPTPTDTPTPTPTNTPTPIPTNTPISVKPSV